MYAQEWHTKISSIKSLFEYVIKVLSDTKKVL